jgi:hypothetical protein
VSAAQAAAGGVLAAAALLALPMFRGHQGGPHTGFRVGPLWTWCPAEARWTPHALDVGGRQRCLSCKNSTVKPEDLPHG